MIIIILYNIRSLGSKIFGDEWTDVYIIFLHHEKSQQSKQKKNIHKQTMGFFSDPLEGNCYTNLGLEWNICVCQSKLLTPSHLLGWLLSKKAEQNKNKNVGKDMKKLDPF